MPYAAAIIGALGALTSLGTTLYGAYKGSKAKTDQTAVSGAQAGAMANQRYLGDRAIGQLGGMSPARYQRALIAPDVLASETQQTINQIATAPFQDAYQKEALSRLMISKLFAERRGIQERISDIDAEASSNAIFGASAIQSSITESEAKAQAERNRIIATNEQIKIKNWSNMARSVGSIAQALGTTVEGIEKERQARADRAAANESQQLSESTGRAILGDGSQKLSLLDEKPNFGVNVNSYTERPEVTIAEIENKRLNLGNELTLLKGFKTNNYNLSYLTKDTDLFGGL